MNEQEEFDQDIIKTDHTPTPGQILDQTQHTQALQRFGGQMPQNAPGAIRDLIAYRDCRRTGKPSQDPDYRPGFVLKACGGVSDRMSRWKDGRTKWGDA